MTQESLDSFLVNRSWVGWDWIDLAEAKSSSVETLLLVPYSKLVPRLDTSWSPVSVGRFTEDWRYVGVRFLMFDLLVED